jgi:outer membrane lipoprotein-sorting protein
MNRREFLTLTSAATLAGLASARVARADDLERLMADVSKARAPLKTLRGPFTQERTIGLLAAKVKSSGTLTLVRPDRLRWELAAPDDVVYWINPEGLAYRSKRSEGRTSAGRLAASLDDLRTVLAGDLRDLRARYAMRVIATEPELAFEATPLPSTKIPVQRITFSLAADRVTPVRVELVEGPRDKTIITFGTLERDAVIDPATMRP